MRNFPVSVMIVLFTVLYTTQAGARDDEAPSASAVAESESCWVRAGERYGISPYWLVAIAKVESNLQPDAHADEPDGSEAIGLMQVNSWWYQKLETDFGIRRDDLWDPCTNIMVGAWILSQEIERYGYSWTAVGAYNAGAYSDATKEKKIPLYERYAQKVCKKLYPDHC